MQSMPFDFLLNYLPANVVVERTLAMYFVYYEKKIVLILRKLKKTPQHNGLWIPTNKLEHDSLKAAIPAITDFQFEEGEMTESHWLLLAEEQDDFEDAAIEVCALISKRDKRIGRVTKKSVLI